ncbi:hypothetical protein WA158_006414 [Blastocystis sp. Blastoise]
MLSKTINTIIPTVSHSIPALSVIKSFRSYSSETQLPSDILRSTIYNYVKGEHNAVILHGLMGNRRNWNTFSKRIIKEYPQWKVWGFDLRGHGDSSHLEGAYSIPALAEDVVRSMQFHNMFPEVIVGHSLGGKVSSEDIKDVQSIINITKNIPQPIHGFHDLITKVTDMGLSMTLAGWLSTSLKPIPNTPYYHLIFDPNHMEELLESYKHLDYMNYLQSPPKEVQITLIRAALNKSWNPSLIESLETIERDTNHQVQLASVHSNHWVHIENPDGLLNVLKPSLEDYE